jgi:hypothetical protein
MADIEGWSPHRSLWYERLTLRADAIPVHQWLTEQANRRGFLGAYVATYRSKGIEPGLSLEEIVVGLLAPLAPADGRTWKLVLRILQSGQLQTDELRYLARRERADPALYWLLINIPAEEQTPPVRELQQTFSQPPRGFGKIRYRYDFGRLIKRPASRETMWRAKRK